MIKFSKTTKITKTMWLELEQAVEVHIEVTFKLQNSSIPLILIIRKHLQSTYQLSIWSLGAVVAVMK